MMWLEGSIRSPGASSFARALASLTAILVFLVAVPGCSVMPRNLPADSGSSTADELAAFNSKLAVMANGEAADGEYTIGPEDLLEVTLFDIEDERGPRVVQARVSNTGFVTLPYIGKIRAGGLAPHEFETRLTDDYKRFIVDPQITVFVREYRAYQISIVGYVERPGIFELRGRRSLLEGLAMAGGLNDEAGRSVRLTRQDGDQIETVLIDLDRIAREGDMSLNVTLMPGDVVNVPQAGMFYVEGMVQKPGAYPLLQEITVSQAVATAGGPNPSLANPGGTILLRKSKNGQRESIPVEIAAIQSGKAADFVVQPDDVIVVPMSGAKYFFERTIGLIRFNSAL